MERLAGCHGKTKGYKHLKGDFIHPWSAINLLLIKILFKQLDLFCTSSSESRATALDEEDENWRIVRGSSYLCTIEYNSYNNISCDTKNNLKLTTS